MTTINDIVRHVEKLTGHGLGVDDGVQEGRGDREIRKATISWMATPDAIRAAGEAGDDVLISHESLYYPYDVIISKSSNSTRTPASGRWNELEN